MTQIRVMKDDPGGGMRRVLVWDLPTRLFHWTLASLVAFSWWSGEQGGPWLEWHFWSGYGVLSLVLFRIAWGLVGSTTARFANFVKGPRASIDHIRELLGPNAPHDLGHNPVGGWMIVVMLAVLLTQASLGLFADDKLLQVGPLNHLLPPSLGSRLTTFHNWGGKVVLWLVIVHVAAVGVYLLWKRQNLVGPMLSGYKRVPAEMPVALIFVRPILALLVLLAAALLVWLLIFLLGE